MAYDPNFSTQGEYVPDNLMAGDHPIRTLFVTIAAGSEHVRGELMAAGENGNYDIAASVDGNVGILVEDVDATDQAVTGLVYVAGDFNANAMTFGDGVTLADVQADLAAKSLYLYDSVTR